MSITKLLATLTICTASCFTQAESTSREANIVKDVDLSACTQKAIFEYSSGTQEGYKSAFNNALKAFESNGDPIASRLLGTLYYTGRGVNQDKHEALNYFLMASEYDAEAAYMAGKMILTADGVSQDVHEGSNLMSQAADMGYSQAQLEMAKNSLDQALVENDVQMKALMEKNSLHYGKKCAATQKECRKILAYIFEHGLVGLPRSEKAAKEMYELAK